MLTLLIDTTSSISHIELINDLKIVATFEWESQKRLGNDLLPQIVDLLTVNKYSLQDVSLIKVDAGPGSYTGTRVGVSTANALAWALDIPISTAEYNHSDKQAVKRTFVNPVMPTYDNSFAIKLKPKD